MHRFVAQPERRKEEKSVAQSECRELKKWDEKSLIKQVLKALNLTKDERKMCTQKIY